MNTSSLLAPSLESFFIQRLMRERNASPHTIAAYRDCFRLLLEFAQRRLAKQPSALALPRNQSRRVGQQFVAFLWCQVHAESLIYGSRLSA